MKNLYTTGDPRRENLFQTTQHSLLDKADNLLGNQRNQMKFELNKDSGDLARELQEQQDLEYALKLQEALINDEEDETDKNEVDSRKVAESSHSTTNRIPTQEKVSKKSKMTVAKEKFSKLFKKNKNDSKTTAQIIEEPVKEKDIQKKPRNYNFSEITKLQDREIISFENPIEGGRFYQYDAPEGYEDPYIELQFDDNNNSFDFFSDHKRFNTTSYLGNRLELDNYKHNEEELNNHFRIDDRSEDDSRSEDSQDQRHTPDTNSDRRFFSNSLQEQPQQRQQPFQGRGSYSNPQKLDNRDT